MAFRFNKRIKIAKGVNLNLSKSGIGMSAGVKGMRVGAGPRGTRVTASVPGTGISKEWRSKKGRKHASPEEYYEEVEISPNSRFLTLIICIFGGWIGLHRFTTGKFFTGIIYLFTFGFFGIGWVFDTVRLLFGSYRDGQQRLLR